MGYKITLKKRAMKALEKINDILLVDVIDLGHRKDIYQ